MQRKVVTKRLRGSNWFKVKGETVDLNWTHKATHVLKLYLCLVILNILRMLRIYTVALRTWRFVGPVRMCTYSLISPPLHSPVRCFWKKIFQNVGGGVAHGDAGVSKINIVSKDFRPIIARLLPVQYKAHKRWIRVGTEGLLLQDTESGDRVGGRCWRLAKDELTVRSCSSLIDSLETIARKGHITPLYILMPPC